MIDFAKVRITSKEDYEHLLDIIDETHIDEEVVWSLKENIGEKCEVLLVEYPYYEKDYLSTYYSFIPNSMVYIQNSALGSTS